jgi:hypothetical protein
MRILTLLLLLFTAAAALNAQDERARLKEYLNGTANEVYNTEDPVEKREILDNMFHDLLRAFDVAEDWPLFSKDEKGTIGEFKNKVMDKHNELNGYEGYEKVADKDLNAFSTYTVQDFEQAAEYVTISIVALILIIIAVALLL